MNKQIITTILAYLTGLALLVGQNDEAQRKFDEAYAKAEIQAVKEFPDAAIANSPLVERMVKMDKGAQLIGDPLFHSPYKPVYLARRAGAELGIPLGFSSIDPQTGNFRFPESEPIPEFNGFKSVEIRKIYSDGIDLKHAEGAGKVSYEDLEQGIKDYFGLSEAGATAHRKKLAEYRAAIQDRNQAAAQGGTTQAAPPANAPQQIDWSQAKERAFMDYSAGSGVPIARDTYGQNPRYRKGKLKGMSEAEARASFERLWVGTSDEVKMKYLRMVSPEAQLAPSELAEYRKNGGTSTGQEKAVWKRYVQNEAFQKANRQDIAEEIRRMEGPAAAEQYLREQQLKDQKERANEVVQLTTSEGGFLQKQGDRITVNGDLSTGYRIVGDVLFSVSTGEQTHTRAGDFWVPVLESGVQIRDPR